MVHQEITDFAGQSCSKLENSQLSLWITREVGPRILGLRLLGEENLMAVLPDAKIPVIGAEDYFLKGGHRLWYGPENPLTTYITDDRPVEIATITNGLKVTQPVDNPTCIQKSFQVILDENLALVTIDHNLTNQGHDDFKLAPWAITMLRPGGVGILPLQSKYDDEYGLLPNRQLVFWPYTEINSPHLVITDRAVAVRASMTRGALKVGLPNTHNWLAYAIDGILFVKRSEYLKGANYLDLGASSQIYCNPDLIELETLGPVTNLKPGDSVEHQEIWQIYLEENWPPEIFDIYKSILSKRDLGGL